MYCARTCVRNLYAVLHCGVAACLVILLSKWISKILLRQQIYLLGCICLTDIKIINLLTPICIKSITTWNSK